MRYSNGLLALLVARDTRKPSGAHEAFARLVVGMVSLWLVGGARPGYGPMAGGRARAGWVGISKSSAAVQSCAPAALSIAASRSPCAW